MSATIESEKEEVKKGEVKSDEEQINPPPPPTQTTASDYAEKFRFWWYQQQCMHQMNLASYQFLYNLHFVATCNYFSHLYPPHPPQLHPPQPLQTPASSTTRTTTTQARQDGRECAIPALWRRLVAEVIDFFVLFLLKLTITFLILDNTNLLGSLEGDMERLLTVKWSPESVYQVLPDMILLEFINRVFISVFEALSLRQGPRGWVGGTTPGKRFMGLRVVLCERVVSVAGTADRVVVMPAGNLLFPKALLRSLFKNFSYIVFPIFLTSFIFEHNRSLYDILSSSMVVYIGDEYAQNFRA